MESIGEKLRATREEKSLSIDQVARDTNIAKRYIVALEDEAFTEFPGEPYLVGFLRNYADYLGLDAEEIVGLYKNFKIQEQPVPMEELLEQKHSSRSPLIILLIVVVIALIVVGVLFVPSLISSRHSATPTAKAVTAAGSVYRLTDEIIERRFVAGDTVVVPVGNRNYRVKLSVSGRELVLTDAAGTQTVKLGEEKSIDLNGDGTPDLKVFLRDVDTQDPAKGVIVRFDRFTQSPKVAAPAAATTPAQGKTPAPKAAAPASTSKPSAQTATRTQAAPAAAAAATPASRALVITQTPAPAPQSAPAPQPAPQPPAPPPAQSQAPVVEQPAPSTTATVNAISPTANPATGPIVIAQDSSANPFTVNVDFTANCLFRYLIDGKGEDQRFFQKGESTSLDVKQNVEIWASNGGALDLSISGNTLDMGNPGEVIARKIAWVRDSSTGGYRLEMTRLQ